MRTEAWENTSRENAHQSEAVPPKKSEPQVNREIWEPRALKKRRRMRGHTAKEKPDNKSRDRRHDRWIRQKKRFKQAHAGITVRISWQFRKPLQWRWRQSASRVTSRTESSSKCPDCTWPRTHLKKLKPPTENVRRPKENLTANLEPPLENGGYQKPKVEPSRL